MFAGNQAGKLETARHAARKRAHSFALRPAVQPAVCALLFAVAVFSVSVRSASAEDAVLDPNKFTGHAKSGYAAAQLCPEICAKLFCYCGCDLTDEHDSLLDCFTTDHGVDCHICQEEALIALKMKRDGKSIEQIQEKIDLMFEKEYPFDEPSPVIQKYRANRLWQPKSNVTDKVESGGTATDKSLPADKAAAAAPKVRTPAEAAAAAKRRATAGSCCSGKGHKAK
jgi:hypothetical protein